MKLTLQQQQRVDALLQQMTLEEKIGQMNQLSPSLVGGFDMSFEEMIEMAMDGRITQEELSEMFSKAERDYQEDNIRKGLIGSVMLQDPDKYNELQRIAVEESRMGIPLIIGLDVIHGFRSVYPIALAEAGAFDPDLFQRTARMAAKESRTQGISWHFAPMIDVGRDSRWGRVSEGPGEDPYLASRFAEAKIHGLQDGAYEDAADGTERRENYVAACMKHYVAYGAAESGRDYNTTSMSISQLHNVYLPPFKAATKAGAATAMASFNDLNGVPCTVNEYTLRRTLKERYGLQGFVVSDANAIRECIDHGIAADRYDAAKQAANAGMDMDMGTSIYVEELKNAVERGDVSMEVIDEAARRILSVKMWLDLFDHPYITDEAKHRYDKLPKEHVDLTLEAAQKSIVLLKNDDHVLPLKKEQKISLVGSLAANTTEIIGAWAMSWKSEDCVSILDGLKNTGAEVEYFPCGGPAEEINEEEIAQAAAYGDVIVAVVGEYSAMSGEASSRADTTLPGKQRELLTKLLATGKPVVTVLMNGRALALGWEAEHLPTIVEGWQLGIQMGNAVASVLFGDYNPTGKLAASFPYVTGQMPLYYNHPSTGRPGGKFKFTSKYIDAPFEPVFPFGYGLSYTTFAYCDLTVKETEDALVACVKVKNTGEVCGTETVQLYMQDVTASLVRPVKELKGFAKVTLAAGEEKEVALELKKADMGFYNNDGVYVREDGKFRIFVGGSSADTLMQELDLVF
ncbi:MAG: glycoside hydrolase family 3 C-terminal domain-containing protein [Clostridiales bacterium]|nr:glycoside hydrolase family 3 C-terminal domain-containing protein [Clostridiales bacterium]